MRLPLVLPVLVALGLAGCGGPGASGPHPPVPEPAPAPARAELAARAAAAKDLAVVAFYELAGRGTLVVVRAADGSWRVDVPGGALGGAMDIAVLRTGAELFQCQLPPVGQPPTCVAVAELTPDLDPRWQHVFTSWLDVFMDRAAPLAVSTAEALPGAEDCYAVEPTAASLVVPVAAGIYCYAADGTLTAAQLDLGELTLTGAGQAVPPTVELPGPVVPGAEPLPTAAPPSPSPGATATPSANP